MGGKGDDGEEGFSDVQQPVSAQLPICMTAADKRIISILLKKKKKR